MTDFINAVFRSCVTKQGNIDKSVYGIRNIAVSVKQLILNIRRILKRANIGNTPVNRKPLRNAVDIAFGNMSVDLHIDKAILFACLRLFALFLADRFAEQFKVHIVADRFHMSVLLCAQNIACTSYFKVTHSNLKARAEFGIFSYRLKPFLCYFGKLFSSSECEIRRSTS